MVTFFNNSAVQLKEAGIDERGVIVVYYALKTGRVTNSDVQGLFKVSKPTTTRLFASLSQYLEQRGTTGKRTYYSIKGLQDGRTICINEVLYLPRRGH